ncbi:MAG: hypothetical protein QXJ75_04980 [Candidatus Bathyarchaeia archaeon]
MGRISSGINCSVEGCSEPAVRSLSTEKAKAAGFKIAGDKRAYLCREHYKALKKLTKKERSIERWRYKS